MQKNFFFKFQKDHLTHTEVRKEGREIRNRINNIKQLVKRQ